MNTSMISPDSPIDAGLWLKAAEKSVRDYCGWHIAPSLTQTLTLDGTGGTLLHLPTMHLTDLTRLTADGKDLTGQADWSTTGMVELRAGTFPNRFRSIELEITHGYDPEEVPNVIALILTLARRGSTQPTVASQSVNGASANYLTAGGAPLSIPLLASEKSALAAYRIEGGRL